MNCLIETRLICEWLSCWYTLGYDRNFDRVYFSRDTHMYCSRNKILFSIMKIVKCLDNCELSAILRKLKYCQTGSLKFQTTNEHITQLLVHMFAYPNILLSHRVFSNVPAESHIQAQCDQSHTECPVLRLNGPM